MDVQAYNKQAWDGQARAGNPWTIPVTPDQVARARAGDWQVLLTPTKPVPRAWFPADFNNLRVLGLASGGGQQGPLLAAAGAHVTILDNSPEQLARDAASARREQLRLDTVEGDMRDLGCFEEGTFDLIFHPCSNCFVPEVAPVWREAFRVLRPGGSLLSGLVNPVVFTTDVALERQGIAQLKYPIPYSDLDYPDDPEVQARLAAGEPLSFGHSLEQLIGGQLAAGFLLAGFYEDTQSEPGEPLHRFLNCYFATRAVKPNGGGA
jgi:SAM-dependent methyltransferase